MYVCVNVCKCMFSPLLSVCVCVCVNVCVCLCVQRQTYNVCMFVCMCVWEKNRERDRQSETGEVIARAPVVRASQTGRSRSRGVGKTSERNECCLFLRVLPCRADTLSWQKRSAGGNATPWLLSSGKGRVSGWGRNRSVTQMTMH